VLDEDRGDRERAFEVRVAAFDRALALVLDQYLRSTGLDGSSRGRVNADLATLLVCHRL
jgi:hypothetical protein